MRYIVTCIDGSCYQSSLRQVYVSKYFAVNPFILQITAQEIQTNTKKGLPTSNIPMKVRSNAKRMDVEIGKSIFNKTRILLYLYVASYTASNCNTNPLQLPHTFCFLAKSQPSSLSSSSAKNGTSVAGFLKANTLSSFGSLQRQPSTVAMRKERGAKVAYLVYVSLQYNILFLFVSLRNARYCVE